MKRKHSFSLVMVFCVAAFLLETGCSQPTSKNSKEAINVAQTIESQDKKVDFLYQQAQNFIGQEEYSEAKQIAEYILTKLDADL